MISFTIYGSIGLCWRRPPLAHVLPCLTPGDRRTASAHDGWEVDLDFMLEDGDEDGDDDIAADAEPHRTLAAVATPTGASSPGSSQYGSASEGGGAYADNDQPMLVSPEAAEPSPPPPSAVGRFTAVAANNGIDNGLEAAPVGSPVGVARQLGAGITLLRHPGTAINVPLTQVDLAATVPASFPGLSVPIHCLLLQTSLRRSGPVYTCSPTGVRAPAQDPPVMTEDTQVEREAALASLGAPCKLLSSCTAILRPRNCSCDVCHFLSLTIARIEQWRCRDALAGEGDAGRDLRAKLTGAMLASDMAAFKAANPGAVFEDVVRWLSPRDWLPGDGGGAGRLSKRMSVQVLSGPPVRKLPFATTSRKLLA